MRYIHLLNIQPLCSYTNRYKKGYSIMRIRRFNESAEVSDIQEVTGIMNYTQTKDLCV